MRENTQLRFYLGARLLRMPYGSSLVIEAAKIKEAWPPTGDYDPDGWFLAMALAAAGHRPEISLTTDQRIERDLDGSFVWRRGIENDDYVFHRRVECCPRCHGSGYVEVPEELSSFDSYDPTLDVQAESVVTIRRIECDHTPK